MTQIDEMIIAHSKWKYYLEKAIETNQSQFTVEEVENCHACAFGKWLDSAEGKKLSDYSEIYELHKKFHFEASKVLALALAGDKTEAETQMQFGSPYSILTSRLVNKLSQLEQSGAAT